MHKHTHTHTCNLCVWNSCRITMQTLHPANRHSARAPGVSVVTGSSRGVKGQSSSSESARSTTTPGWRHWGGEIYGGWVVGVSVCVWDESSSCAWHSRLQILPGGKKIDLFSTYVVDVGNVVFLDSDCLWKEGEFEIFVPTLRHAALSWRSAAGRLLPRPASRTPRSLSPWSGTSCRSPGPPYSRSSSS